MKRTMTVVMTFLVAAFLFLQPACADDLQRIKAKGELTMAMSGQYPPFNFVNDKNELAGFDVEIGKEIARRIGVTGVPISTAWDGIIAGLLAKKHDLICGSMAITEERLKSIDFSDHYYRSGAQMFVKKGSPITSVDDLAGKKIGVTLGTTFETWIREHIKDVDIRTYKGDPDIILEVTNGRLDGFVTDRIVGALAIKDKGAPIQMVGDLLYEEKMGIAMRQDNPELKQAINEALQAMKDDGTYKEISMKWLGIDVR
ncbi:ABC transporter substrate-binding protein [Desulfofustis glycolicus]|uniref:Polar amino acid transport system substrate-binding protein n=1 Tax=Desulfofustis glycolicus DSM 9705 TaxID=1121409 RepID=A0A1M5SAR0_9BACT|nr:ABC transporter substrate-binding protein [Desulfofustis glycolicus]MCB2216189.1 ABC transporter substrate-binding protein [Desulfobulbaceae bacterium]SHH35388.1 polar amino acid transport system substrate-binding protein [Desulfofustis glycolicus DSM 9705]